jgi:hypothetical protein
MCLSFTIAANPRPRIHSQVRVLQDSWPHSTVSDSRLLQPGGQVPVFISSRNMVTQLYPRYWVPFPSPFTNRRAKVEVIRTYLHTLEDQSAMPWRINSRRTEYKTPPPPPQWCLNFAFVFVTTQAWTGPVESHVTTDGQSASQPLNKAPIWGPRPDFHLCHRVTVTLIRPPYRREDGCAAYNRCRPSPAQAISGPSLEGPSTTLNRLRFETSLFVASHDSQGHGGGSRPRLHMGLVISTIF